MFQQQPAGVDHVRLSSEDQRCLLFGVDRIQIASLTDQSFQQRRVFIVASTRTEPMQESVFVLRQDETARGTGILQKIEHRHVTIADRMVNPRETETSREEKRNGEVSRSKLRLFVGVVQVRFAFDE